MCARILPYLVLHTNAVSTTLRASAAALVVGVLCAPRPCLAQAARGPHFTGQFALAEGIGESRYQGPTVGVGDARYTDHFNALTPELTLGALYQQGEHWALGLDGVAGIAPSINSDASIPGVPLGQFAFYGAEALARASFNAGLLPTVALTAGFVVGSFTGTIDAISSPKLVTDDTVFKSIPGFTASVSFEPHALQLGSLTPFVAVRVVHLWHGPATTTLVMPTLGVSLFL
jgi:hypothetical protein